MQTETILPLKRIGKKFGKDRFLQTDISNILTHKRDKLSPFCRHMSNVSLLSNHNAISTGFCHMFVFLLFFLLLIFFKFHFELLSLPCRKWIFQQLVITVTILHFKLKLRQLCPGSLYINPIGPNPSVNTSALNEKDCY